MAVSFPGAYNTYIPSFDASGELIVAFSRNPKEFAINKYISLVPVKKSSGWYLRITPEQAARVINTSLNEFHWPDGNDAPSGAWGLEGFEFFQFETSRYAFPYRIGYKANEQADWKILASHGAIYAQQAMTARAVRVLTVATTSGNYPSGHTDTATNWGGGLLNTGTADGSGAGFVLKKALNAMAIRINKSTLGVVKGRDLVFVIDPVIADALSRSKEVHAYLKESPFAMAQVRGDKESSNGFYGLPDQLYGISIVVDDTVRISSKKGATASHSYVLGGNTAFMCARPGGLESQEGAPSFSTFQLFSYEDMTVESKDDPDNRRVAARVVDDYDVRMVAPVSGALCTAVLS